MNANQGYLVKNFLIPTKRFCQMLKLKDVPDFIDRYRAIHSPQEAWPEIRKGIRDVGILEMEIYISGNQLFMIVETPVDFDWDVAMKKLADLPRQADWEKYVEPYQECMPDCSSSEKWQLMERMFYLYD